MLSESTKETKKIGEKLGKEILLKKEIVFLSLEGDLGSGKTTFVKGLAKGLGVDDEIVSPTFLIYKRYSAKNNKTLYHFDAYRISEKDLPLLGFEEIIKENKNIIVVEWGENIRKSIPEKSVKIIFSFVDNNKRKLIVENNNDIIIGSF